MTEDTGINCCPRKGALISSTLLIKKLFRSKENKFSFVWINKQLICAAPRGNNKMIIYLPWNQKKEYKTHNLQIMTTAHTVSWAIFLCAARDHYGLKMLYLITKRESSWPKQQIWTQKVTKTPKQKVLCVFIGEILTRCKKNSEW